MELALFVTLATIAVGSAFGMIVQKNAVRSVLFLILNFGCIALLFLMLDAPFISMVQIAVYAGAIMVLFLFVIMLLGAEETTDTDARQFGWLTQAATVLAVAFLVAMAIPMVLSGGLDLPDAQGDVPQLRIVHAANINLLEEVEIENEDGEVEIQHLHLAEIPINVQIGEELFEDLNIIDTTAFREFEPGEYDVVITDDELGSVLYETTLSLESNQVVTFVAHGTYNQTTGNVEDASGEEVKIVVTNSTLEVAAIPNDLEPVDDNTARINVLNLVTEQALYLVDLGRDRQLDVADGEISDVVLTDALAYGETSTVDIPVSTYNLRMVAEVEPGIFDILAPIGTVNDGWTVVESTEQTFIFTPDYESTADGFGFRNTVLTGELDLKEPFGSPGDIGGLLFIDYLLPVNLVGFLLLVALIGVIVLTRPEGATTTRRSTLNRRRKVSRPLVGVIAQQTGRDVVVETPKLDEPGSGD